jgi:hypothetical protein
MRLYHVVITGIKKSDGGSYKLETCCEAESIKEVESTIFDYDWSDAETMLINIWPAER